MQRELDEFTDTVLDVVKSVGDRLTARIEALERRALLKGDPGERGERGEQGEPGEKGERGADADPAMVQALQAQIETLQAEIELLKSVKPEAPDVSALVAEAVQKAVGAIPVPKDALIDRDGHLVLTLSDGGIKALGCVMGPQGVPGPPGEAGPRGVAGEQGADGITFTADDISAVSDLDLETRQLTLTFGTGERAKAFPIKLVGLPLDRGLYDASKTYERGDLTQRDGSWWVAVKDAPAIAPGNGASEVTGWRLAIKRGRDGKDGAPGKDGKIVTVEKKP
jgi:hypothetical protein